MTIGGDGGVATGGTRSASNGAVVAAGETWSAEMMGVDGGATLDDGAVLHGATNGFTAAFLGDKNVAGFFGGEVDNDRPLNDGNTRLFGGGDCNFLLG